MNLIKPLFRVSGMTLISRLLGFIRDILIAATFGAGSIADAFFIALKFPNIFRRIMAEGALNMSFIPMFSKKLSNKNEANIFFSEIFNFLFWSLLLIVSIFEILMPALVFILAPGFLQDPKKQNIIFKDNLFDWNNEFSQDIGYGSTLARLIIADFNNDNVEDIFIANAQVQIRNKKYEYIGPNHSLISTDKLFSK